MFGCVRRGTLGFIFFVFVTFAVLVSEAYSDQEQRLLDRHLRILITSFDRYEGFTENSSDLMVQAFLKSVDHDRAFPSAEIYQRTLTVDNQRMEEELVRAMQEIQPDIILSTGQFELIDEKPIIGIELIARNQAFKKQTTRQVYHYPEVKSDGSMTEMTYEIESFDILKDVTK